jgi:hypothetical protein
MTIIPLKKECKVCKKEFFNRNRRTIYCCLECSEGFKKTKFPNLLYSTVGTISELKVCNDLLIKGFYVFRSITPNCPCDLVVLIKNKIYRVEVKTGYIDPHGNVSKHSVDQSKFDILAIVTKCDKIFYKTKLPIEEELNEINKIYPIAI